MREAGFLSKERRKAAEWEGMAEMTVITYTDDGDGIENENTT